MTAGGFRAELRSWLEDNLDPSLRGWSSRGGLDADVLPPLREWNRRLADAGYAAIAWPVEYGGRGAGADEQLVWLEEMARAQAPATLNPIGIANIAPAIMQWGSAAQRERYLRPMLRGDEIWCQGFSEPDAGSDLASLRCRAVDDGAGGFVVEGEKVWNTLGAWAQWCELLVRTDAVDAGGRRHDGLSMLLVDMSLPGVEATPLRTMTGDESFAALRFDGVRVDHDALLGPRGAGWKVAMATLGYERAGVASLHLRVKAKLDRLVAVAGPLGPVQRQTVARCHVRTECLRFLALRAMASERSGAEASIGKLAWTAAEQAIAQATGELVGPAAVTGLEWHDDLTYTPATAIAGGTTEVQKTILAERILGLPR